MYDINNGVFSSDPYEPDYTNDDLNIDIDFDPSISKTILGVIIALSVLCCAGLIGGGVYCFRKRKYTSHTERLTTTKNSSL